MTSNLLKPEKQLRIEKAVASHRSTHNLDVMIQLAMGDGNPISKGSSLLSYRDFLKAGEYNDEAAVTEMLASVYLKGAVDQLRSTQIKKSISSMQCTCKRVHPFTKSKIICPCGNELQGETEGN